MIERADRVLGGGLERLISGHHRRRMAKIGHSSSLTPSPNSTLWAQGDPAPRRGNSLDVLIDTEQP